MAKGKVITVAQQKRRIRQDPRLRLTLGVMLVRAGHSACVSGHRSARVFGTLVHDPSRGGSRKWHGVLDIPLLGGWATRLASCATWRISLSSTTPPKADSDFAPGFAPRLIWCWVPIASSHVDLWATDGVLDLARREGREVLLVLNRAPRGHQAGRRNFGSRPKGWPPIFAETQIAKPAWPMRPALVKAWVPPKLPRTPPCAQSWKPCWAEINRARWMRADTAASANRQT